MVSNICKSGNKNDECRCVQRTSFSVIGFKATEKVLNLLKKKIASIGEICANS
jgi:hypothetical protein